MLPYIFLSISPEVGLCDLLPVCVCVSPYQLLNASTNLYETWYVCHEKLAHLNGGLHKYLPSVYVSVCLALLSWLG
jgi:hypothetical protein